MATKWGICGTGKIAEDFCTCLNFLPDSEHQIRAVASHSSKIKAQEFAGRFGIPRSYGSYDELAHSGDVDVVYVATINPLHLESCLKFIHGGKAVLCEKPMAMSLDACRKILDAAKNEGVLFVEAFLGRFFPGTAFIKQQLMPITKTIGDVRSMEASICLPLMHVARITDRRLGGGGLLDIGCYALQAANLVFRENPEMVWCDGVLTSQDENGVDKSGVVALRYSADRFATVNYSIETAGGANTMVIRGTKGNIQIADEFWLPETVTVNGRVHQFPLPDTKHKFNFRHHQGLTYQAQSIRECLKKGLTESPLMPHADSLSIMSTMQTILDTFGISYQEF